MKNKMKMLAELEDIGYKIPAWCNMHILQHYDGVGGCWGINYAYVEKQGEEYCRSCEYYKAINIA